MNSISTPTELKAAVATGTLREVHTAAAKGYVSRKGDGIVKAYSGKFGEGYTLTSPRFDSTRYVWVTYYVR